MFCDAVHYVTFTFDTFMFCMLTLCAATLSNIHVLLCLRCVHLRYANCNLYSGGRRKIYILFYSIYSRITFDSEQRTRFFLSFSEKPLCTREVCPWHIGIFFESTVFPNTIRTSSFRRVTSHTSKFKLFYNVHVVAECA